MIFYSLAPISNAPEMLLSKYPQAVTLAAWYRFGDVCPDTEPAFVLVPSDFRSDVDLALQAIIKIGAYLFDPEADKPINLERSVARALYESPFFRVIEFLYEDSDIGRANLATDVWLITGQTFDTSGDMATLKVTVWELVKALALNPPALPDPEPLDVNLEV